MSIVKEIDKISGTDTRSKNIEDAVKKLELGGGSGGISIIEVPITVDGGDVGIGTLDLPTYDEVLSMWEDGIVVVKIKVSGGNVAPDFFDYYPSSNSFGTTRGTYVVSVSRSDGWIAMSNPYQ